MYHSLLIAGQFALAAMLVLSTKWWPMPWLVLLLSAPGILLASWAWVTMGLRRLRIQPTTTAQTTLIRSGPYAIVRHPMYAGLLWFTAALLWNSPSWWRVLMWLALLVVLIAKTRVEETSMSARFSEYADYQRRVGGLFPWRLRFMATIPKPTTRFKLATNSGLKNDRPAHNQPASIRRHDLDSLRAIAMLLGLVVHASMSFLPELAGLWPVQDAQASSEVWLAISSVHGFRMPLFFLISGFFTAMLWRKRGIKSLLVNRAKRILVPLIIAMVTISPAMVAVSIHVVTASSASAKGEVVDASTVWIAAANGDRESVDSWIAQGIDMDRPETTGSTPLAAAILFGRPDVVQTLIDQGADLESTNMQGEPAIDMLGVRFSGVQYVGSLIGMTVDKGEWIRGREQIADLLSKVTSDDRPMALLATAKGELAGNQASVEQAMSMLTEVPVFYHLWFLVFLCWLVAGFLCVVSLAGWLNVPGPPSWLTLPATSLLWAIPLTAVFQYRMPDQGSPFGPATSSGLLPIASVLAYYAVFFAWGAMHFEARTIGASIHWGWIAGLPLAVFVLLPMGLSLFGQTQLPGAETTERVASAVCQVAYAWLVTWGLMSLFEWCSSGESKAMRYLSDSSYWLYLIHLPMIIYAQFLVQNSEYSPWLKIPAIVLGVSLVSLVSYQALVRYTAIGTLLNGKRVRVS